MPRISVEKTLYYEAALARLWPLISDTNLLAELRNAARYHAVNELQIDGSVLRRAKGQFGSPMVVEWTEDFGEWVEQRYIRQQRNFSNGPFCYLDVITHLSPVAEGFEVRMRMEAQTRGVLGWIVARAGIIHNAAKKVFSELDIAVKAEVALPPSKFDKNALQVAAFDPHPLAPGVQARLDKALENIGNMQGNRELLALLGKFLADTPSVWLERIRPLVLAQKWNQNERTVTEMFLAAHSAGLVRLRWEILCPRCRNASDVPDNIADLPKGVHCTTCNINYEQKFSENVELTFQPEDWLRPLSDGAFCMMGAPSVPHIKVQRNMEPGERLELDPPLEPGNYRFRTTQAGDQTDIFWDGKSGFPLCLAADNKITVGAPADKGFIWLENQTEQKLTFVIEELVWRRSALTGDQAIALPAFRKYCPEQILRSGDDVAIANVVLLFTDLKGSTSLYETMGDAAAYNLVRDHFDYLANLIDRYSGVMIKTIGDSVMAAFSEAGNGMETALRAQLGISKFNNDRSDGGVILKLGLHQGSCIAVTTDSRLDYFGSTINIAARLQGKSNGNDIVFSDDIMDALGVSELILENLSSSPIKETALLRGVDRPFDFWRIKMALSDNLII